MALSSFPPLFIWPRNKSEIVASLITSQDWETDRNWWLKKPQLNTHMSSQSKIPSTPELPLNSKWDSLNELDLGFLFIGIQIQKVSFIHSIRSHKLLTHHHWPIDPHFWFLSPIDHRSPLDNVIDRVTQFRVFALHYLMTLQICFCHARLSFIY